MKLAESDLKRLLPEYLGSDPQFEGASLAVQPVLQRLARSIPNLLIYARLGEADPQKFLAPLRRLTEARPGLAPLDMPTLESLAWQFHVDFREVARTREELAGMVRGSIAWHRIKGTPASIRKALKLFGYENIEIEEHPPDMPWASYMLGFRDIMPLADIARIVTICREMQPARCRLWRVYNDGWDQRPGINDYGDPERYGWDNFWWDYYSGTDFPEIPGLEGGLIVSFGAKRAIQSFAWQPPEAYAGLGHFSRLISLIPYDDHFIWDRSSWEEIFVRNHGFTVGELLGLTACSRICEGDVWPKGPWDQIPWAHDCRYDRALPAWRMFHADQPKSQLVPDDASDKLFGWSGWDDINSNWDVPFEEKFPPLPDWDFFVWDDERLEPEKLFIPEQFTDTKAHEAVRLEPKMGTGASVGNERVLLGATPWPVWDEFLFDGEISRQITGRMESRLISQFAAPQYKSGIWQSGQWRQKPWAESVFYDRQLPSWLIWPQGISESQFALDWSSWDDLSCHDIPGLELLPAPALWDSFGWDEDDCLPEFVPLHSLGSAQVSLASAPVGPCGRMFPARLEQAVCRADPYRPLWDSFVFDEEKGLGAFRGCLLMRGGHMAGSRLWDSEIWQQELWAAEAWGIATGFGRKQKFFGAKITEETK